VDEDELGHRQRVRMSSDTNDARGRGLGHQRRARTRYGVEREYGDATHELVVVVPSSTPPLQPASSSPSMAELRAPRRRDSAVGARGPEASSNDELNVVAASTAVRARSTTGGTPRHGTATAWPARGPLQWCVMRFPSLRCSSRRATVGEEKIRGGERIRRNTLPLCSMPVLRYALSKLLGCEQWPARV
jgi:hypothetical protein